VCWLSVTVAFKCHADGSENTSQRYDLKILREYSNPKGLGIAGSTGLYDLHQKGLSADTDRGPPSSRKSTPLSHE
jgi:hypothetical protein